MKVFLSFLLVLAIGTFQVLAKSVFAHFMMSNSADYTTANYQYEITLAQQAGIDAFALNIGAGEATNGANLQRMFTAAESQGFRLAFSFDYAGNGAWSKSDVIALLKKYTKSPAYFKRGSQPVVSTFEGPSSASDWADIKTQTNTFFIPSYSSLGAKRGVSTGVVDGLFNWGAWPEGPNRMDAHIDASYLDFLGDKAYMMPVSPWFYTNMPGFNKNWMWRGDHLWFDRWTHIWVYQPEFVQIITWNDWGESHYIGPLSGYPSAYEAFDRGKSPFNYVSGMPHDAWRMFLPYVIEVYKTGTATITREGVSVWYRKNPKGACNSGGTTGNTANQVQTEMPAADIVEDRVFFSALLGSTASVYAKIGGVTMSPVWDTIPDGGVGLYHGSFPTNGLTGEVIVQVSRGTDVAGRVVGTPITTDCTNGFNNWNAYTAGAWSTKTISARPRLNVADMVCTKGTGRNDDTYNLKEICEFNCKNGYCPLAACTCMELGKQAKVPAETGVIGFPKPGALCIYLGLCSYACNHGFCPPAICTADPAAEGKCYIPPPEPDVPEGPGGEGCIKGKSTSDGNLEGLCDYSCHFGFCPEPQCTCLETGNLNAPPAVIQSGGYPLRGFGQEYADLCKFTWTRGYEATSACQRSLPGVFFEQPSPGSPTKKQCDDPNMDLHWKCYGRKDCSIASNIAKSPSERWAGVEAQQCLEDVTAWYQLYKRIGDEGLGPGFPSWITGMPVGIGYGWGGMEDYPRDNRSLISGDFHCEKIGASACIVPVGGMCGELQFASVAIVEQAFANVNALYTKYWNSIGDIENTLNAQSSKMGKTFIRTNPDLGFLGAFKEILGAFDIVFQFTGASIWEKALSANAFESWTKSMDSAQNVQGTISDSIGVYEWLGGEVGSAEQANIDNLENISQATKLMIKMLRVGIESYMNHIFDGGVWGNDALATLLNDGLFIDNPVGGVSQGEMGTAISAYLTASLIKTCWNYDTTRTPAILIDTDGELGGPLDFWTQPRPENTPIEWVPIKTSMIYKEKSYSLLGVPTGDGNAGLPTFQALTGQSVLDQDNEHNEWGITWQQLIKSAVDGWEMNDKKNPYSIPKSTDLPLGGPDSPTFFPFQQGVATPGFFNVPVCEVKLAKDNWRYVQNKGSRPCEEIFPCCPVRCIAPVETRPDIVICSVVNS